MKIIVFFLKLGQAQSLFAFMFSSPFFKRRHKKPEGFSDCELETFGLCTTDPSGRFRGKFSLSRRKKKKAGWFYVSLSEGGWQPV